jgi:LysM repeat protein
MKMPRLFQRKKLRASTARRSFTTPNDMDYEEMSEPNMKLSRALLIVLVLHIVAVAGIIAFNAIKTRQGSLPPPPLARNASAEAPATTEPVTKEKESAAPLNHAEEKAIHTSIAKEESKTERPKHIAKNSVADSGKTYVVVKGDNPVTIARKFKVSYDILLALNHIDDPRKLKIGQKLLIPAKAMKSKKSEESKE